MKKTVVTTERNGVQFVIMCDDMDTIDEYMHERGLEPAHVYTRGTEYINVRLSKCEVVYLNSYLEDVVNESEGETLRAGIAECTEALKNLDEEITRTETAYTEWYHNNVGVVPVSQRYGLHEDIERNKAYKDKQINTCNREKEYFYLKLRILESNYRWYMFYKHVPTIVDVLHVYENTHIGPKRRNYLLERIREHTGLKVELSNSTYGDLILTDKETGIWLRVEPAWYKSEYRQILSRDGDVLAPPVEELTVCCADFYERSVECRIREIREAYINYREKREALEFARQVFNDNRLLYGVAPINEGETWEKSLLNLAGGELVKTWL